MPFIIANDDFPPKGFRGLLPAICVRDRSMFNSNRRRRLDLRFWRRHKRRHGSEGQKHRRELPRAMLIRVYPSVRIGLDCRGLPHVQALTRPGAMDHAGAN